jgi:hypothetical protein
MTKAHPKSSPLRSLVRPREEQASNSEMIGWQVNNSFAVMTLNLFSSRQFWFGGIQR